MKKALRSTALLTVMAVAVFLVVTVVAGSMGKAPDADPHEVLARSMLPYLQDGSTFALAEAYPYAWDTVQIVRSESQLTEWEWRTLRDYDAALVYAEVEQQVLVFWHDGDVAGAVRLRRGGNTMPWFEPLDAEWDSYIVSRESAVFRTLKTTDEIGNYFSCTPEYGGIPL